MFAGITVVIALAGLAVVGIPFLTVMGLAAAVTVLLAVLIAVTLLPGAARLRRPQHRPLADRPGPHRLGRRVARHAQRPLGASVIGRPGVALVGGLAIMLLLAVPMLSMRLGMPDAGTAARPTRPTARPTTCSPRASGPASTAR